MGGGTALVLGGGGPVGWAWMSGVLAGLTDAGVDLDRADVVIGTSAGAILGSRLTTGETPGEIYERQLVGADRVAMNVTLSQTLRFLWAALGSRDPDRSVRRLARAALAAHPEPDPGFLDVLRPLLHGAENGGPAETAGHAGQETAGHAGQPEARPPHVTRPTHVTRPPQVTRTARTARTAGGWPERDLRITAVDALTGEVTAFDATSQVTLLEAVAASCAVPLVSAPVTAVEAVAGWTAAAARPPTSTWPHGLRTCPGRRADPEGRGPPPQRPAAGRRTLRRGHRHGPPHPGLRLPPGDGPRHDRRLPPPWRGPQPATRRRRRRQGT